MGTQNTSSQSQIYEYHGCHRYYESHELRNLILIQNLMNRWTRQLVNLFLYLLVIHVNTWPR